MVTALETVIKFETHLRLIQAHSVSLNPFQEQPPISMVTSSPLRTPASHSIVTSSLAASAGGWSPSTPQYRGEPRIPVDTTPGAATGDASNVRRDEASPGKSESRVVLEQ